MKKVLGILVLIVVAVSLNAQHALALTQFKKEFTDTYVTKHKSDEFKALAKKTSCNVCHVKGEKKSRKALNAYALELEKLIEGDANDRKKKAKAEGGSDAEKQEVTKLLAELKKAFKKVEDLKSPTEEKYGVLLKAGKLPVDPEWAVEDFAKKKAKAEAEGE